LTESSSPSEIDLLAPMRMRLVLLLVAGSILSVLVVGVVTSRHAQIPPNSSVKNVPLSVSCAGPTFCAAVDDQGRATTFNGTSWAAPTLLHVPSMTTVDCPGVSFCLAGDINGSVFVLRGHRWSRVQKVDTASAGLLNAFGMNGITAISCTSDEHFCLVGDVRGRILTYSGSGWSPPAGLLSPADYAVDRPAGLAAVVGVSCPTARFCAAATVSGRALTWNGTSWSAPQLLTSPDPAGLRGLVHLPEIVGISCASPRFCAAIHPTGYVQRFDGNTWSAPQPIDTGGVQTGNHEGLTAVSCPTPDFCMAVDDGGRALAYNGSAWASPIQVDPTLGLTDVSCPTPRFCVALDELGNAAVFDGHGWTPPQRIDA